MRKRVAVVGATGIAGQQFLLALAQHPWFEIVVLAASERSAGKTYRAALRDPKSGARRWWCPEEPPAQLLDLPVENADGLELAGVDVVFSAIESDAARELEARYAQSTPVLSTASAFRYDEDVPIPVSATCTRVAVSEGHTEAVAVSLGAAAPPADVAAAFGDFGRALARLELPSAPHRLITVHDDPFRPQPRLDRDADGGMTTSVGRIRTDDALEHGMRYVLVSHNTKMGAAKGAVLTAEVLVTAGYI